MQTLQEKRAAYIGAVQATRRAKRSFTIRARQRRAALARLIANPTRTNRAAYRAARRIRAKRLETWRSRRATQRKLKANYIAAKKAAKDPRTKAVNWALAQVGTTEATGNNDGPKIHAWQRHTARGASYLDGEPYCGIGCENACAKAGVDTTSRWASVAAIEDDARVGRGGFRAWTTGRTHVRKGDLVILYGRGVHVEIVRARPIFNVKTVGFNTSPGTVGSQSNGGGVYKRTRPFSQVHGFALVRFK